MDTNKQGIRLEDLSREQKIELARQMQIRASQPEEPSGTVSGEMGFKHFEARVPSAKDDGGRPNQIHESTSVAITKVKDGEVDASILAKPDASAGGSDGVLEEFNEARLFNDGKGGSEADRLTRLLQSLGSESRD